MNYTNEKLLSSLAAEYVLGTLRGSARKRFETLIVKEPKVQNAVHYWESQLNSMATNIEPVTAPEKVWVKIEQQLGFSQQSEQVDWNDASAVPPELTKQSSANQIWKVLSSVAVAASFVLAVMFYQFSSDTKSPQYVAVFANAEQQTLWSLDILKDKLFIRSTQNLQKRPQSDYQLWIVPQSGDAPISLGLLRQEGTFTLPRPDAFDLIEIAALAVSLEPKGGSPTGAPTEVLYAAELAQM